MPSDNPFPRGEQITKRLLFAAEGPTPATGVAAPGDRPAATACVAAVLETAAPPDRDRCINRLENRCPLMATVMGSRRCRVTPSE